LNGGSGLKKRAIRFPVPKIFIFHLPPLLIWLNATNLRLCMLLCSFCSFNDNNFFAAVLKVEINKFKNIFHFVFSFLQGIMYTYKNGCGDRGDQSDDWHHRSDPGRLEPHRQHRRWHLFRGNPSHCCGGEGESILRPESSSDGGDFSHHDDDEHHRFPISFQHSNKYFEITNKIEF